MLKIIITFLPFIILISNCFSQHFQAYNNANSPFCEYLLASYSKKNDTLSLESDKITKKIIKYRNPFAAGTLAIIPGFIFHGAGHFYARKPYISTALFIASAVGLWLIATVVDPSGWEGYSDGHPAWHINKYYDLQYYSGSILWWGTWAYDLIGAPIVCVRHNKRLQQKISVSPYMEYNRFGQQSGVRLCLWF